MKSGPGRAETQPATWGTIEAGGSSRVEVG